MYEKNFSIDNCFLLGFSENAAHISNRAKGSASAKHILLNILLPLITKHRFSSCARPARWYDSLGNRSVVQQLRWSSQDTS